MKAYYAARFFHDFIMIYPFYSLLFRQRGASESEIGWLLGIWSLSVVVFELPAGLVSDRMRRRTVLLFSVVAKALAFILWMPSSSFILPLAGFIFWGLSEALKSGTEEAWLYEKLSAVGRSIIPPLRNCFKKTPSYEPVCACCTASPVPYGINIKFVGSAGLCSFLFRFCSAWCSDRDWFAARHGGKQSGHSAFFEKSGRKSFGDSDDRISGLYRKRLRIENDLVGLRPLRRSHVSGFRVFYKRRKAAQLI